MKKHNVIILLVVCTLLLLPVVLNTWGLTESSEARYAQISKEMYISGQYLHPTLLGILHYHKPPLTYYITALGYAVFGINETGARFFLMLSLIIQLLLVYKISKAFFASRNVALAAMLFYFSFPIVYAAASNLTTDCYLTSFVFGAVYSFICYRTKQQAFYLYLFFFLCGLAFLTKGPVGLLPQCLFAICYNRMHRPAGSAGFHFYTGLLLGLLVCFSWFILLIIDEPALINYFVKYQLVDRVASNAFNRSKPWWYYIATIPLLALPAITYFFFYLKKVIGRSGNADNSKEKILLQTFAICLLVFSISSSKLVFYVLPLYLFIAMLCARQVANMSPVTGKIFQKISLVFSCVIFAALITSCFVNTGFAIPIFPVMLISLAGLTAIVVIYLKEWKLAYLKGAVIPAVLMASLLLLFPFVMKKNELKLNSIKPLAGFINSHSAAKKTGTIAVYDYLLPSLEFYTGKKILTLDNGNSHAHRETQFENNSTPWKNTYIKMAEINKAGFENMLKETIDFVIAKKNNDVPDSLSYLKANLQHSVVMEKWIIYY